MKYFHQRFSLPATPRRFDVSETPILRCSLAAFALLSMTFGTVEMAFSQALSPDQAVESARRGLDGFTTFPWYDAELDRIRRIEVSPFRDLENRHSRWERQPVTWNAPGWLGRLFEGIVWIVLAVLLALLVYWMVRAFLFHESAPNRVSLDDESAVAGDVDRVDSLPFQLDQPHGNLLEEARRLYQAGQFGEAITYLYSYQLVQLDKHQLIRLRRGKTNRQYLREIRRRSAVRPLVERTMVAFEDVFFGNHPLDRDRFESCWQQLDRFHNELQQALG